MSVQSVLLPVFVYVLLVYGLLGGLIVTGSIARRSGAPQGEPAKGSLGARVRLFSASYSNQFELPVLFFAVVALALLTRKTDAFFLTLEWLFVIARAVHAGIHVTVNAIPLRGAAFAASAAILGIAWITFALEILAG